MWLKLRPSPGRICGQLIEAETTDCCGLAVEAMSVLRHKFMIILSKLLELGSMRYGQWPVKRSYAQVVINVAIKEWKLWAGEPNRGHC